MAATAFRIALLAAALSGCSGGTGDAAAPEESATPVASEAAMVPPVADQVDPADDATVAGTAYNATAEVPCGGYGDHKAGMCEAGVVRRTDRSANVTITYPGGKDSRTIFFDAKGGVTGADVSEADGSAKSVVLSQRKGDVTVITIGSERYEINDALVTGG